MIGGMLVLASVFLTHNAHFGTPDIGESLGATADLSAFEGGALTRPALNLLLCTLAIAALWLGTKLELGFGGLLPLVLLPLFGVASVRDLASAYMSSVIFLLLGGFMMARVLEEHGVPEVIAARLRRKGQAPGYKELVLLMMVTLFMSMWLSNTASTLIMMGVGLSMAKSASGIPSPEASSEPDIHTLNSKKSAKVSLTKSPRAVEVSYGLGIAYAANIGGMLTPVGTAPNAIALELLSEGLDAGHEASGFVDWLFMGMPLVLCVPIVAFVLLRTTRSFFAGSLSDDKYATVRAVTPKECEAKLSTNGLRAVMLFGFVALMWCTRKPIDIMGLKLFGWSSLLGLEAWVDDGWVSMFGVTLMALCPAAGSDSTKEPPQHRVLMPWNLAKDIPWDMILLFGGGLALANAFKTTGLSLWLGRQLAFLSHLPLLLLLLVLCLTLSLLTEITSNTATATLVLPLMLPLADALQMSPLALMWPAAMSISCAFMLPMATPPNAIAAGQVKLKPSQMAWLGLPINLLMNVAVALVAYFMM